MESCEELGYQICKGVLSTEEVSGLIAATELHDSSTHTRQGSVYANRSAIDIDAVQEIARAGHVRSLATRVLGATSFAVRAILFDKVEGANWKVPWHQDLTISVKGRDDVDGYGPWSMKEGTPHVQPPAEILEQMISIRLHLDNCGIENGPLRVIPKSHLAGRIPESQVDTIVQSTGGIPLTCKVGDAILMRPLLLHASSPATSPNHRRVLHIDFANCELAPPLQWANRIS